MDHNTCFGGHLYSYGTISFQGERVYHVLDILRELLGRNLFRSSYI